MPNLAQALKAEVSRLARKELKDQMTGLRQAVTQHRRDIAKLKRQCLEQEKRIAFLQGREKKRIAQPHSEEAAKGTRFSARSVKAQRERLNLSAADFAKLVGVSMQSIYAWEQGRTRPRLSQRAALVELRGIGRREALARLKMLDSRNGRSA